MTTTLTYLDPRRSWVTAVLTTGSDTLGPLTGPVTTSFPCDPVTSAAYAAVVAGSLVGTIVGQVPPHTPGKKPL
jgi:hypothetical protein